MPFRFFVLTALTAFVTSCNVNELPTPEALVNDYKVHTYYVVPADKNIVDLNINKVWTTTFEMQRWYQTATGGLTFEILDEENILEVYFADQTSTFYADDWWGLLLNEMNDKGLPIEARGTINMIWIEGIGQISDDALALGATMCEGECGAALMPVNGIFTGSWIPTDLGPVFHEMGHTLGLAHPLEYEDLPVSAADSALLQSVMCQGDIRAGTTSAEHGFLTNEKEQLKNNSFLKPEVPLFQKYWTTNIINYPVTGQAPEVNFAFEFAAANIVQFSVSAPAGSMYYWYFGDGSTSNEKSPSHGFASGLYNVTLMVTTPNNMATRVSQFLEVP
jgi:hypothetical protein